MSPLEIPHFDTKIDPQLQNVVGAPLDPTLSAQREEFFRIYDGAYQLAQAGHPDETVNAVVGKLGDLDGVTFLTEPDFKADEEYRCAEWAFGSVFKEEWAVRGFITQTVPTFWANTVPFLASHGFEPADGLLPGDVIAYGDLRFGESEYPIQHFGIYWGEHAGRQIVYSKLCQGPVASHPLSLIATHWGDKFFNLRKSYMMN